MSNQFINRSTAIDYVAAHKEEYGINGVAYVYFNYKQQVNQTILAIFESLIVQLLHQVKDLEIMAQQMYEKLGRGRQRPTLDDLTELMSNLEKSSTIFLAFDALDEATAATRLALISQLDRLKTKSYFVLLTSRPGTEIKSITEKLTFLDITAQDSDLETYARYQMENNEDIRDILDGAATLIIP